MYCPNCGLAVAETTTTCPRCGNALPQGATPAPQADTPQVPSAAPPQPSEAGTGVDPRYYGPGSSSQLWGYAAPPTSPPTDAPAAPSMPYPPPPGYGYGAPPSGYGYGAPPSGYGYGAPQFGQAAPPSYPMYPGQSGAPGYPPPGYLPAYPPPGYPTGAPPRLSRSRTIWISVAAITAAVLILCIAAGGLLYAAGRGATTQRVRTPAATTTPSATDTPQATATTPPPQSIIYQNALTSASPDFPNDEHCAFKGDGYHVYANYLCFIPIGSVTDANVTVTVKQVAGPLVQPYGIAFRLTRGQSFYEFDIDGNSEWVVFKCTSSSCDRLSEYKDNNVIKGGLNAANTLSVHMLGSHFEFFVNGTNVGQVDDSSYATGRVSFAGTDTGEVVYTNLVVTRP